MKSMKLLASASFVPSVQISGLDVSSWDKLAWSATALASDIKPEPSMQRLLLESLLAGKSPVLSTSLSLVNGTIRCRIELSTESFD